MLTSAFAYAGPWKPKRKPFRGQCLVNDVPHPISPEGIVRLSEAYAPGTVVKITYEFPPVTLS